MALGKTERERPPAYSRIAFGLVICGLALGGVWALTLVGVAADLLLHLLH